MLNVQTPPPQRLLGVGSVFLHTGEGQATGSWEGMNPNWLYRKNMKSIKKFVNYVAAVLSASVVNEFIEGEVLD